MACDAAIRVLLKDMMIWCLLFTRSIGLISLSALLNPYTLILISLACELGHTTSGINSITCTVDLPQASTPMACDVCRSRLPTRTPCCCSWIALLMLLLFISLHNIHPVATQGF